MGKLSPAKVQQQVAALKQGEQALLPVPAPDPSVKRHHAPKRFFGGTSPDTTSNKRAKSVHDEQPALSWVSCDECQRWRRITLELTLEKWCCNDNLDPRYNSCNVPQEMSDAAIDRELGLSLAAAVHEETIKTKPGPPQKRGHCEHGRQRSQCKECGGASICQHGRRRSRCKECGGSSICQHGRGRTRCVRGV